MIYIRNLLRFVECPIGDFFGVGHGESVNFWSLPLSNGSPDGNGFNYWFPMPFSKSARIEVENETNNNAVSISILITKNTMNWILLMEDFMSNGVEKIRAKEGTMIR